MFQIERTVGSSHLGPKGNVSMATLVDFMQDCCGFHLDSEKALTQYFKENNVTMFLLSRQIEIRKPAKYGDKLFIRTSIYSMKSAHGYRNTLIYNDKEELLVASYTTGAFIDMNTLRPATVPKDVLKTINMSPKFDDMEYLPRKVQMPKEGGRKCSPMPVYRHYIDENDHVNNARYFDIGGECLPDGFDTKHCRVEYKTAAKEGDIIMPLRFDISDNKILLSLTGQGDVVHANFEFQR